jgi:GNAT superfamily N-acetyltransferase
VEIRPARVDDYDTYARLQPQLGVDDPVPSRERFGELVARTIVAVDGDAVVGYALFEVLATTGYIRNVVADEPTRRRGVGSALMTTMHEHFVACGATAWCLNVKADNVAAIALYERCGLRFAYRTTVMRLPREVALPAPPSDVELVPLPPDADATVEPAFQLLAGQLASARTKTGRQVVQLRRGGAIVGVGVFMPAVPGSFPFRLADPTLAAAALTHLRAITPAGAPWLQVSAEDDDALRDAVLALGAYVNFEIQHMRGAL